MLRSKGRAIRISDQFSRCSVPPELAVRPELGVVGTVRHGRHPDERLAENRQDAQAEIAVAMAVVEGLGQHGHQPWHHGREDLAGEADCQQSAVVVPRRERVHLDRDQERTQQRQHERRRPVPERRLEEQERRDRVDDHQQNGDGAPDPVPDRHPADLVDPVL